MLKIVLGATAMLALFHLYFWRGKSGVIDYIYFAALLIVMGLNSYNADYEAYEKMYQGASNATSLWEIMQVHPDKGYVLLNWLASLIGMNFVGFRFMLFALSLGIIFVLAKRLGAPISLIYLVYLTYPMFMDIIQVRNFIISVVVFLSVYCYARAEIKWYIIGVVALLISVTIHPFTLIFIPFIVFYKVYHSRRFRMITYIPIGLGLLSIVIKMLIDAYWTEVTAILTVLTDWAARGHSYVGYQVLTSRQFKIYLVVVIFTWLLYKAKNYLSDLESVTDIQKRFVELSFSAYLYLICWMPFFALNINLATRMPRDLFLLAYISLGIYIQKCTKEKEKWGIVFGMLFLAFFFGLVDLYIGSERFNVNVIIKNNLLL